MIGSGGPLEAVAQSIWVVDHPNWSPTWQSLRQEHRDYYFELAAAAIETLELREEPDPDQGLAARQILRAYIDDENLVRKAFGELFGVLELREEWTWSWPNGAAPGVPGYGYSVETREEAAAEADSYMTLVRRWVSSWTSGSEQ